MKKLCWMILLLSGLVACNAPGAQGTASKPGQTQPQALEGHSPAQVEAAAKALQPMLAARHAEDLPSRGDILKVEHGPQGLLWQARQGNPRLVRARALELLRHFPDAASRRLLLETATGEGTPASLRAAAIRGLSAHTEEADPQVEQALTGAAADEDRRVRQAAREVLKGSKALRHLYDALPPEAPAPSAQDLQKSLSPR